MEHKRNKDNLTDLVDEVGTINDNNQNTDGKVETPSGQVVNLGAEDSELRRVAKLVLKTIRARKNK